MSNSEMRTPIQPLKRLIKTVSLCCLLLQTFVCIGQKTGEIKIAPLWGIKNYTLWTESVNEFGASYEFLTLHRLGIETGALLRKNHTFIDFCPICFEDGYDWRLLGLTLNVKYHFDGKDKYTGLYLGASGAIFSSLNSPEFLQMVFDSRIALAKQYKPIFPANPLEIGATLGYKILILKHLAIEPLVFYGLDLKNNVDASSRQAITVKFGYRF